MFLHDPAKVASICFCLAGVLITAVILVLFVGNWLHSSPFSQSGFVHKISRKSKETGAKGEFRLWVLLERCLNNMAFKILHDVHLPIEDKMTQIDFLVVSCWGIFVIEAKTMNASIYGEATDEEWIAYYDRAIPFRNPLLQNQWHIQALSSCLGLDSRQYMTSIVAFSEESTFRNPPPANVMHFQNVPDYILSHMGDFCFRVDDLPQIVNTILEWDPTIGPENHDEHTMNIPLARIMRSYPPIHPYS